MKVMVKAKDLHFYRLEFCITWCYNIHILEAFPVMDLWTIAFLFDM